MTPQKHSFSWPTWAKTLANVLRLRQFFGKASVIALPYGWHLVFFLVPFCLVLKISFSESIIGAPPYADIVSWVDNTFLNIRLNLENYTFLLEDTLYLDAYLESLRVSGLATLVSLCLAYPIAYNIAKATPKMRIVFLCLIILPFWTSFLIRVYAWMGILSPQGLINSFLKWTGLIESPLTLLHNDFAVCLGIVYSYLPFMILPLYVALEKIDPSLLEAAHDLGCKPMKSFFKVTLPLSLRGAVAGSMLVFIPGVGEYIIPELLGGPDSIMIGKILWGEFFTNRDWPLACALAMALLVLLVLPITIFQKLLSGQTEG
ncbi:MAG: ABC transporter permease subunit [Alphaproteobacteria bacterium]|nr:ABC transporter permease subunit [Alphaproteobacteria bacterium]